MTRGLDLTIPLHDARYIVAFHRKDCVKMIGCPNEELARKAYNAVSPDLAKILFDRRHREVCTCTSYHQLTQSIKSVNRSCLSTEARNGRHNVKTMFKIFLRSMRPHPWTPHPGLWHGTSGILSKRSGFKLQNLHKQCTM